MNKWTFYYCENIEEFKEIKLGQLGIGDQLILSFTAVNGIINELNLSQPERSKREDVNCPHCGMKLVQNKKREMLLFCNDCSKSFYENEL